MSFKVMQGDVTIEGDFSQLEKLIENLGKGYSTDVGVLGRDGTTMQGNKTLAGIGADHEFGKPSQKPPLPRRSFIRMPIETGQRQIENDVGKRYQQHMEEGDIKGIFEDIGFACERRIKEAFESGGFGEWKELSPVTIERKGSDTILVDKGILKDGITSQVNE